MTTAQPNRFQDFFKDKKYIALKDYLYNYLLRKEAIGKVLPKEPAGKYLEVGTGSAPVVSSNNNIVVYTDISHLALKTIRHAYSNGMFVAADVCRLPFKSDSFSCLICSEVLEHVQDDKKAFSEIARVVKPSGSVIITFPHRRSYYAFDDRFVGHYRRYELSEMESQLKDVGLTTVSLQKVLGPLEKVTMLIVTICIHGLRRLSPKPADSAEKTGLLSMVLPVYKLLNKLYSVIVRLDSKVIPLKFSSVLLIKAVKK